MAALMHHNELRVNAPASTDPEQMAILHEKGWRAGPHTDTDPDDPADVPRVLPAAEDEPEATPTPRPRKAASKKAS
jgi:hypothetical protein